MGDRPKFSQLTASEIDRLLTDSPPPTRGTDDLETAAAHTAPKIVLTQEDLALLDETGVCEQSPADVERGQSKDVLGTSPQLVFHGRASSPPLLPIHGSYEGRNPTTRERSSLSKLVHGWSTLMGHPISVSASPQSTPIPIFSPLITQSSKLLTGVVSSLLSPWAVASKPIVEKPNRNLPDDVVSVQDRLSEDSLVNAFEKIAFTDSGSEHEDVFFSPNREREGTAARKVKSTTPIPTVQLRDIVMGDTPYELQAESSLYSDAVSAQPSPMRSATKVLPSSPCALPPSSLLPGMTPILETINAHCTSQLTPTVPSDNVEVEDAFKTNAETCSVPENDIFYPDVLFEESGNSRDTFTPGTPLQEAVNMLSQNAKAITPVKSKNVDLPCPTESAAGRVTLLECNVSKTPTSVSKLRVPCSPFPMMISMLTDEEGNRARKSGGSSVSIDSRRKSKPTSSAERSKPRIEFRPQEVNILNKVLSPDTSNTSHRVSIQEASSLRSSGTRSSRPIGIIAEASINSQRLTPHLPPNRFSAVRDTHQQASAVITSAQSYQNDKENISPGTPAVVTRRLTTHRSPVLSVVTVPIPATRPRALKPTTQASHSVAEEGPIKEKARLRQEIELLKANEDSLRTILSKYAAAFEQALDQSSQVQFATSSARAQVGDEICETQRLAPTLHNAVLDSYRRHERMREAIEKSRLNQEELLCRVKDLKEKYIRQSEKGITYQKYCLAKIQRAIENMDNSKEKMELELGKLRVQSKQLKIRQESLEAELQQKAKENQELTSICDSLVK